MIAAPLPSSHRFCRPYGASGPWCDASHGLTPVAMFYRPSGAPQRRPFRGEQTRASRLPRVSSRIPGTSPAETLTRHFWGSVISTAQSHHDRVAQASCLHRNRGECMLEACPTNNLALYCYARPGTVTDRTLGAGIPGTCRSSHNDYARHVGHAAQLGTSACPHRSYL